MRLIVDANIVLRNVLGKGRSIARALESGVELLIPEAQLSEAANVLTRKFDVPSVLAYEMIEDVAREVEILEMPALYAIESSARARLELRGQSDWPVVAAALLIDADIWSNDRDFFGAGGAVWSSATVHIACAQA